MLAASGSAVAKADAVHQTAHSVLPASAIRKVSRLPPWCLCVHADFKLVCQKVVIDEDEPKPSETPHAAWPKLPTKDDQGLPVLCACFRLRQLRKHSVQCKHPLQRPTWHKASGQENPLRLSQVKREIPDEPAPPAPPAPRARADTRPTMEARRLRGTRLRNLLGLCYMCV